MNRPVARHYPELVEMFQFPEPSPLIPLFIGWGEGISSLK
jgi:hypothetical protein